MPLPDSSSVDSSMPIEATPATLSIRSSPLPLSFSMNAVTISNPLHPGRFKIIENIGAGTFGTVDKAIDSHDCQIKAVKTIIIANDEAQRIAVEREVQVMEGLNHPNIVNYYGHYRDGDKLFIYLEFVPCQSLSAMIETMNRPLPELVIRQYTRQITEALHYLHSNHVVHRDVKAKNILISQNGSIKLADFGASKYKESTLRDMAASSNFSYTPLYVAPEVLTGHYNEGVDIWALGCVVVEMASGLEPWTEKNFQSAAECFHCIATTNEIPKIPSDLCREGKDFARLCLDRNPDTRPTAQQLLQHPFICNIGVHSSSSSSASPSFAIPAARPTSS